MNRKLNDPLVVAICVALALATYIVLDVLRDNGWI